MDNFKLNFDESQAEILLKILSGDQLNQAKSRELIPLMVSLEVQLGAE